MIIGKPNYYTVYSNIRFFGNVYLYGQFNYFDIVFVIDYIFGNIILDDFQIFNSDLDFIGYRFYNNSRL